jgi:integrase
LEHAGRTTRDYHAAGALRTLLAARVLRPSYSFLLCSRLNALYRVFPGVNEPEEFARLRALPAYQRQAPRLQLDAEACLVRVMIRTGKPVAAVTAEDLLAYADLVRASGRPRREHLIWELLVELGPLAGQPPTLRAMWTARGNSRQHTVEALVDRYDIPPSAVRDLLVDYLAEIRPSVDYSTLENLAYLLGRLFWWTVLQVNPDQQDLRLAPETASGWRDRLALTRAGSARQDIHAALSTVRAFYRDLQQWALEDPVRWGVWVAPSPVRDGDLRARQKARRHATARMQQRTRVLTGQLPVLTTSAVARRDWSARLLEATAAAEDGQTFRVDGVGFRRHNPPAKGRRNVRSCLWVIGPDELNGPDGILNVTALERDCFWAWALIETLRLTGARIEEVLELTQLSIRHYTPASTGTLVPLLHIAPSKLDIERLIPMNPELVGVLVAVQRRAKHRQQQIPLSVRYDPHEKVHGPALPHLFARPLGARHEVLSVNYVRTLLIAAAQAAGLADDGQALAFTPHDFRRLFTTDLVGAGLPLHIAAALLGHLDLNTTRGYTAVFPDDVITHHQRFLAHRRTLRDSAEYRDVTTDEWSDFETHFQLRRVELGDCFRPYGTPCSHEHACIRCPFLRLDPAQAPRLTQIEANTVDRIAEARGHAWLGEVAALEETLRHIHQKKTQFVSGRAP